MPSKDQSPELSLYERREILADEIEAYVRQGYRVMNQTNTTAELIKPKGISRFHGEGLFEITFWPRFECKTPFDAGDEEELFLAVDVHGHIGRRRQPLRR